MAEAVKKLIEQPKEEKIELRIVEHVHVEQHDEQPEIDKILERIIDGARVRLEVYKEWIGDGTRFVLKRLTGASRAFWGGVWQGHLFPLRMKIVDFETGKDELANARFIGRLSGLVVVSAINSVVLLLFRHKKFITVTMLLGLISLFSEYAWTALQLVIVFAVTVYMPLGFWKARTYRGLKHLIVEELNRVTDTTKKCENDNE
jgi:hypothetical protein